MRIETLAIVAALAGLCVAPFEMNASALAAAEDTVGTAPAYCSTELCPEPKCAAEVADGLCSGSSKCGWAQQWEVEGSFNSGTGEVKFSIQCGGEDIATCSVGTTGVHCQDGPKGPGKKEFGCFYDILKGLPDEIAGRCVDPLNPEIIYLAVPVGTPYEMDKYAVQAVNDAETAIFRAT